MTPRALHDADVIIIGAGPVGLLLGNFLGLAGVSVIILEALPDLIDYPRGVGIDDESLRTFQATGLIDKVLPHTMPRQAMRFVNGKGRVFASIDPLAQDFGWLRRSTFIQPLIDRVSADGLQRFPHVSLKLSHQVTGFAQDAGGVTVTASEPGGSAVTFRSAYLVGADGGRSPTREASGIAFSGKTEANRWVVVDIADDPMGYPNCYLNADPVRPYANISLPHGIRRLEFMLFDNEGTDGTVPRELLNQMLSRVMPEPERINLIRARVYTHNGRLADRFRDRRVMLAGDAAHIMPVWQGQGFNSGVRDAFNLGWKLALVAKGICGDGLLDSYETERKEHARAMIDLSVLMGTVLGMRNPFKVALRDAFTWAISFLPPVKRYFQEMRFKPMPRYKDGALDYGPGGLDQKSPVGRMFIQPRIALPGGWQGLMDDVLGNDFALLSWGVNPQRWLDPQSRAILERLGTKIIWVVPMTGLAFEAERHHDAMIVGDLDGKLKAWFGDNPNSMILLRPDRFMAVNCGPQHIAERVRAFGAKLDITEAPAQMLRVPAPDTAEAAA